MVRLQSYHRIYMWKPEACEGVPLQRESLHRSSKIKTCLDHLFRKALDFCYF